MQSFEIIVLRTNGKFTISLFFQQRQNGSQKMSAISFVLIPLTYPESKNICPPVPHGIIFIVTFIHCVKLAYQNIIVIQHKNINNAVSDITGTFGYHLFSVIVIKQLCQNAYFICT